LEDTSIEKIIHAADNDIRGLDRHCGLHIRNLFDTSIAARTTGITHLSLAALISNLLGINIDKSKRLQRSDWGQRPLSREAIQYAATDVIHLFNLREILTLRLNELGRTEWATEECARIEKIRYTAPNQENAFFSVKGGRDLDERGLAILSSLFDFREEEARRQHRPPFFVLTDTALVFLAGNPEAHLSAVPGLGQAGLKRLGKGLREALSQGLNAQPVSRPRTRKYISREQLRRFNRLKEWRTSLARSLSLDPSILWPLTSLEQLAREPDTIDSELESENIRRWQRNVFADSLMDCLDSIQ
jgi:ribonuclease D